MYFLQDIGLSQYGLDIIDSNFAENTISVLFNILNSLLETIKTIRSKQIKLWEITENNMLKIRKFILGWKN